MGRVAGPRGKNGEITVRVRSGEAGRWVGLDRVLIARADDTRSFDVEAARAYRDRLVLKLRGVDDAGAGSALKGAQALALGDQVPPLPEGMHYAAWIVGSEVREEAGETVGRVIDVMETGAADLLVVEGPDGREVLVPMVREIVRDVREDEGVVTVRLPDGLRELNREQVPGGRHARTGGGPEPRNSVE